MVCRNLIRWVAPLAMALVGHAAPAGSIATPTGNAEVDFPAGTKDALVLPNKALPGIDPEGFVRANGLSPGWQMKDVRLSYDASTDRLAVGVNFFGVAGDADNDGNAGNGPILKGGKDTGFIDMPHLGGRESITIGFDLNNDGKPDIVAGVPSDKSKAGQGLDGFTVAQYQASNQGFGASYGKALPAQLGGLLFDPSATNPDFEFVLTNFSKLPGYNPETGFTILGYAGTPDDGVEEAALATPRISFEQIPEPTGLLAWGLVLVGGAWKWRHRRPKSGT